ncbi:MAG: PAS domain-containing protein [Pirellulales bacterium]
MDGYSMEKRFYHKDTSILYTEISANALRKSDGSVDYFVALVHDVSNRKRAEKLLRESKEHSRLLLEMASDSIVLINPKTGRFVEFNQMAHEHLGYTREEFEKMIISDIEITESSDKVAIHIEKILYQKIGAFQTKHKGKDVEIHDVYVRAKTTCFGGKILLVARWQDFAPTDTEGL